MEETLTAYLDKLDPKERVKKIDDLLHVLNYERRVALLTRDEMADLESLALSPEAVEKLRSAKTEKEREELIKMYARARYFRKCAWVDYLNGVRPDKPVIPKKKVG